MYPFVSMSISLEGEIKITLHRDRDNYETWATVDQHVYEMACDMYEAISGRKLPADMPQSITGFIKHPAGKQLLHDLSEYAVVARYDIDWPDDLFGNISNG